MMTDVNKTPERYTSYHSDKTHSILEHARWCVERRVGFSFEYRGLGYAIEHAGTNEDVSNVKLHRNGPKAKFLMPDSDTEETPVGELPRGTLASFKKTDFESFIETFEIEGKTVKWILEHQKEWKYKLDAAHLEQYAGEFTFAFVYRKIPCCIHEYVNDVASSTTGLAEGYYINITPGVLFDVTPYAPLTPGAEHWSLDFNRVAESYESLIMLGPYATIGELLDRIQLGDKTLRELFDTEYDDGAVLCAWYGV